MIKKCTLILIFKKAPHESAKKPTSVNKNQTPTKIYHQKSLKIPTFSHNSPLNRLTIKIYTFVSTFKKSLKPLPFIDIMAISNQYNKLDFNPRNPHHTNTTTQTPPNPYKIQKPPAYTPFLGIFTFLRAPLKLPLSPTPSINKTKNTSTYTPHPHLLKNNSVTIYIYTTTPSNTPTPN